VSDKPIEPFKIGIRERASRSRAALLNALGVKNSGFFINYEWSADVSREREFYDEVYNMFRESNESFVDFLSAMKVNVSEIQDDTRPPSLHWENRMFSPLDSLAAYTIVRKNSPKQILEIGSGASSRVLAKALRDTKNDGRLVCIDPEPRQPIEEIADHHFKRVLCPEDVSIARGLERSDILFIDSSHIMIPGMDVDIEFNRMFPNLSPGVLVHIHDIFLPHGYPCAWRNRFYSEQNALIGWILSGYFEVIFPSYYAVRHLSDEIDDLLGDFEPMNADRSAGSIWLRRSELGVVPT